MTRFPATFHRRPLAGLALACVVLGTSGGCVYRVNIQQGNFLEKRSTDQLQVGMTRVQVRYLLGTPMVPSIFDTDRWDYLYYLKVGEKAPIQRLLTVYFKDEKVTRIDEYGMNPNSPAEPARRQRAPLL